MIFLQPLASAVDLQPCAIDQDVDGPFLRDAIIVPLVRRSRFNCTMAQGRVIGNGEIQPNQLQHRDNEAFRLTQPKAEHQNGGVDCSRRGRPDPAACNEWLDVGTVAAWAKDLRR